MKKLLTLFLLSASVLSFAQVDCEYTRTYIIAAESGMKMRSEPKAGTPVVTYVMHDSVVTACEETFGAATFEEIDGHWRRVNYKGNEGYMFDGFLTRIDTPTTPPLDTTALASVVDSVLNDSALAQMPEVETVPEAPPFIWERTERDEIPSGGRLDQAQIRGLASALRKYDLRMDSLIGFLHKLPTKGSQDSVIAWIDAGMPGGKRVSAPTVAVTTPTRPAQEEKPKEQGPPPIEMQMATEAYNYCGDIGTLDPSMNWYAVLPNEQMGNYRIKRVNLEILVSRSRLGNGGMEFDIRNSSGEVSHFMFGINRRLDTTRPYQLAPDRFYIAPSKLYPGQQLQTYAYYNQPSAANVFVSATGKVIEVGACPVIEDYTLKVNTQGPRDEIVQDITPLFPSMGECGLPDMYWFGDLNGDNYPELIYVSPEENKNVFTMLMSNVNLETGLYELASTWTIEKCK
ncbi:MAG: hypothetical protein HWE14_00305 [Flavobacteriia bacterium]|nr:hypothetical protein [Flavobacteriia bacterium]